MLRRLHKIIILSAMTLLMTACGGGGDDGGAENPSTDSVSASISFQGLSSEIEILLNSQTLLNQSLDAVVEVPILNLTLGDSYSFSYSSAANQFCRINNAAGEVGGSVIALEVNCLDWVYPLNIADDISPEDNVASRPVVSMNENGDAAVVWVSTDTLNNEIYASVHKNGVWDHPDGALDYISLSDIGTTASSPDVNINASGAITATWAESDGVETAIYVSKYENDDWTSPVKISQGGLTATAPKVSMNDAGKALVVWELFDNVDTHIYRSEDIGFMWTNPAQVDLTAGVESSYSPAIKVGQSGDVLIVWEQTGGTSYRIFRDHFAGSSWSGPQVILNETSPNGLFRAAFSLDLNANDEAIVVWEQSDGSNYQVFRSEYKDGSWTDPLDELDNISPDGGDALNPSVALNDSGEALIAWSQSNGSDTQIFISEYKDGSWTDPVDELDNISPDGSDAHTPKVAINNEGHRVIAWNQIDDEGADFQVFKSEYFNESWTHPSSLTDFVSPGDGQSTENISLSINSNSEILLLWDQFNSSLGTSGRRQIFLGEHRQNLGPVQMQQLSLR